MKVPERLLSYMNELYLKIVNLKPKFGCHKQIVQKCKTYKCILEKKKFNAHLVPNSVP